MMSGRYRILLTGGTTAGFDPGLARPVLADRLGLDQNQLNGLLRGEPQSSARTFSADEVLALQQPLQRAGVVFEHLQITGSSIEGPVVDPRKHAAGMMHCPACGHAQSVARSCEVCGVVFEEFHRATTGSSQRPPTPPPPTPSTAPSSTPHALHWDKELRDDLPTEEDDLALFVGRRRQHYLQYHLRTRYGIRNHFQLGWNWGAVISPFLWAMYRKMWFWSLLLGLVDVILPVLMLTLGERGVPSDKLVYVGYGILVANRLFWPLVADYVYIRHVRGSVAGMHAAAPTRAAEIDIATAGGTSKTAVFFGLCMSLTAGLFVWSLADSVLPAPSPFGVTPSAESVDTPSGSLDGDTPRSMQDGIRVTHANFNKLAEVVTDWREQHPEPGALARLTMTRLRKEMGLQETLVEDAWGSEIQILPSGNGFRLISAGPDLLYATGDDLVLEHDLKK